MHLFIFDLYGKIRNDVMEGVWKANVVEVSPNCPRCGSSNTKFCYYNNYSLTQPRYFCKGCRRYWTKGGSLRNVPVGGGCRKNRRGKSFRILTDRLASKDLAHPNEPDPTGSVLLPESTASSDSKIDLALVYANFLNQKAPEMAEELTCHQFHPSNFQVAANSDGLDSLSCIHDQLPPDSSQLNEENNQILFGVGGGGGGYIHSIHNHHHHDHVHDRNYANIICGALPPLPDQEILWPNISQVMMVQNQTFHQTQFPGILHPEVSQDPNAAATTGNWSPFDLSCYETFSRP